jgi:hypothetical protein
MVLATLRQQQLAAAVVTSDSLATIRMRTLLHTHIINMLAAVHTALVALLCCRIQRRLRQLALL